MLNTMFQGNQPSGSGEEHFFRVFTIYGHGGRLGHVTCSNNINFLSLFARRLQIKFTGNWPRRFREECLKYVDKQLTYDLCPRSPNDLDLYNTIGVKF